MSQQVWCRVEALTVDEDGDICLVVTELALESGIAITGCVFKVSVPATAAALSV